MSKSKVSIGEKTNAEIAAAHEVTHEPLVLVCAKASSPSHFDDDLFGECSDCGEALRYRPKAPNATVRILKCIRCALIEWSNADGDDKGAVIVSSETVDEVKRATGTDLRAVFRKINQ